MTKTRSLELDFGPLEKSVRWLEETPAADFAVEVERRLAKVRGNAVDDWFRAAACAATRSIRMESAARVPHGLLTLSSARSLYADLPPEGARSVLRAALRQVHEEIHHPGFGPYRLLHFEELAGEGKEGTLFSFLEAVRAGDTDWADHHFAWLVRNLEREQVVDLLLSSGLEGATGSAHKVIGVVEVVSLLQGLGWDWARTWLRPIVRHQAGSVSGLAAYEECREMASRHDLLRVARRRPPGQAAWGERDPEGFFAAAVAWSEADARERAALIAATLADETGLEDAADLISVAAALLFLQETLRKGELAQDRANTDRRIHLMTAILSMRHLVRLGTPGQRVLGLLLAGWVPPAGEVRLQSRVPDCAWWLPPVSRLLERASGDAEGGNGGAASVAEMIRSGQPNGILPALTVLLQDGGSAEGLARVISEIAPELPQMTGLGIKFERAVTEAYRATRAPQRWMLLWAAALAFALWPSERTQPAQNAPLQGAEGAATLPP